jgi:hypothetical protein
LSIISGGYQSPTLLFTFSFIFISFNKYQFRDKLIF